MKIYEGDEVTTIRFSLNTPWFCTGRKDSEFGKESSNTAPLATKMVQLQKNTAI